jgi:hypothetical protein
MKKVGVSASRIVPRVTRAGTEQIDTSVQAHNPQLLEISVVAQQPHDDPETWASLVHQQRQSLDYRDALANPLCLHLAKLASEYLLPYDPEASPDVDEEVSAEETATAEEEETV